jgi:hypothetical protein
MQKLYLLPCIFMLVLQAEAQHNEVASPTVDLPQQLVSLHQGDVFTIRAPYSLPPKRSTVRNIIRVAGIAAMAYGTEKVVTHPDGKTPVTIKAKSGWLLPLGAGMTLTADQLAGRKKDPGTFITYQFYDKDMTLVSTKVVKVTSRQLKKSGGIAVTAAAPQDGFLHAAVSDDVSYGSNDDWNNGVLVEVQPNKAALNDAQGLAVSPVNVPLAAISAGWKALPEKLGVVDLAMVHPSASPVKPAFAPAPAFAPVIKSVPAVIFKSTATTDLRSNGFASPKSAPLRPAYDIPGRSGEPGRGLPDPFILFPPVDRGIFNPRFSHGDLKEDEDDDDDDDDFYDGSGNDGGGDDGNGGGGDDDDDDDDDSGDDDDDGSNDVQTLPPVTVYPDTPYGITQTQPISTGMSYYDDYTGSSYQLNYSASVLIDDGAISGVRGGGVTISPAGLTSVVNGITTNVSLSAGNFTCVTSGQLPGSSVTVIWTCTITETVQTFVAGSMQLNYTFSFEASAQQYVTLP